MAKTLYDKLWESHVVDTEKDGTTILYIDRHLLHEVTSPQAFEGLRIAGRKPWRDSANLLVADRRPDFTFAGRNAGYECKSVQSDLFQHGRQSSGHRARHRA